MHRVRKKVIEPAHVISIRFHHDIDIDIPHIGTFAKYPIDARQAT